MASGLPLAVGVLVLSGTFAAVLAGVTLLGLAWTTMPAAGCVHSQGVTVAGEKAVRQARERHAVLDPARRPVYAACGAQEIGTAVALFGDQVLQQADPELYGLLETQEFYVSSPSPGSTAEALSDGVFESRS
ncbi:hypothetical protein [Streptosporangium sp. NPDC000396]|uniref:hypothetical protein n=1 Tax=Streptosporangium sp. NPDC000396 TaxID=3366185 RepID=UPI0036C3AE66